MLSNQFKVSKLWAQRLQEHHVSLPAVLRRAGLPAGFFQQEKIYVTTAELFALWSAVGEMSGDPVIGLKLGAEARLERHDPAAIAAVCSRSFRDAVQRIAFYKQLTCPEEIRIRIGRDETSVEYAFIQTEGDEPDVLVLDRPFTTHNEELLTRDARRVAFHALAAFGPHHQYQLRRRRGRAEA